MERVTGIGGIFIKARDPRALRAWYHAHLGIDVQPWGGFTFHWQIECARTSWRDRVECLSCRVHQLCDTLHGQLSRVRPSCAVASAT